MMDSWKRALRAYSYPVDLRKYRNAGQFPGFFDMDIAGDRKSTMAFEKHYRKTAPTKIEPYFEVIYWKLFSQGTRADTKTHEIVCEMRKTGVTAPQLWNAIQQFIDSQTIDNVKEIRKLLGLKTNVLAVPLTFPALASPEKLPMVDMQVARWVNKNHDKHNNNREKKLIQFKINYTSLRDNDFPSYLSWVAWCQEVAQVLTRHGSEEWRVRDVEMAIFTAERKNMKLEVLPKL